MVEETNVCKKETVGASYYKRAVVEKRIFLIEEIGSHYVGHTTPTPGSEKNSHILSQHFVQLTIQVRQIGCSCL